MPSNGVDVPGNGRTRAAITRWVIRLLVAIIVSVIIVLFFLDSGAIH